MGEQNIEKINAEIVMAEKKCKSILYDLEQLQITKKKAFDEYDLQIASKKNEIKKLTIEGERLAALCRLHGLALADLEEKTPIDNTSIKPVL